jgi:2-succinyl-6-hydroxy-2,4-cyclohexadiene-1-carboxylate synthase
MGRVPESVVLLHGFGGTGRAWDGVASRLERERYRVSAPDLPGHGEQSGWRQPITFAACVEHVLARAPRSFALAGYSQGGRVALHVALAAPERVRALALISSSAGIEDAAERAARRAADGELARELEEGPYEEFIERWREQPLFADEPREVGRLAREDQRRNSPRALAAVLRGIGAGAMEPLWSRLGELAMPASVIVGERDSKYVALGERLAGALADGRLVRLPGGHALPLESPGPLAEALAATARRAAPARTAS